MLWVWVWFILGFLALVALDLGVFHRRARLASMSSALLWTSIWIGVGVAFTGVIYLLFERHVGGLGLGRPEVEVDGRTAAVQYLAGFLTEKVLNLDILFVIAAIFAALGVRPEHRHRVLFWGLLSVVFVRAGMVLLGAQLIEWAGWVRYIFAAMLIFAAGRMFTLRFDRVEGQRGFVTRLLRRFSRLAPTDESGRFFTRIEGKRAVTPLFVALVMIEVSDFVFAIDTIPGVLSVTEHAGVPAPPFVLVTSNVFAVLGLRALYSVLEASIRRFHYLRTCLSIILAFVAVKLLLSGWYDLSPGISAFAIVATLLLGVVASILDDRAGRDAASAPLGTDMEIRARKVLRQARKVVVLVIGSTILLLAIPIGALPGPGGLLVAFVGLAILATEFVWAKVWLNRVKRGAKQIQDRAFKTFGVKSKKKQARPPEADAPPAAPPADAGSGPNRDQP